MSHIAVPFATLCANVKLASVAKTNSAQSVFPYQPPPPNPHSLHPLQVRYSATSTKLDTAVKIAALQF